MSVYNVSDLIKTQAKDLPDKKAIIWAKNSIFGGQKYPFYTFREFEDRVNKMANQLSGMGVGPQDKVLFFVKPNLDFSVITYALFRLGAIVVFIDPGMKREYFFNAIKEVNPDVLIGIPKVHYVRKLFRSVFSSIKLFITTGAIGGPFTKSLYRGLKKKDNNFKTYLPSNGDLAAILYTSGGTGAPKGVEYTHDIFINQTKMLQEEFSLTQNDIDIPGFPLFSFFTLAMGMSSCVPNMDPSKPSEVDPRLLVQNISDMKASFLAGSPAIWERIVDYCVQNKIKLPTVKYLVMFGAPVRVDLHKRIKKILPNGTSYTPYGATECLPVSNISGKEILQDLEESISKGAGTCVGHPLPGVQIRIIESKDGEISENEVKEVENGQIGEILVHSPNVTKRYYLNEDSTSLAKINISGNVWHRMGDVGYKDKEDRLWFCGRAKHVVEVSGVKYYPNQVETIFNGHSLVSKSALIRDDKENAPAIVIERKDGQDKIEPMFLMDLKNLAQTSEKTKNIQKFYIRSNFPVDVRHNIKIDRTLIQDEINNG